MDGTAGNSELINAAVIEYLSPNSVRKIVRRPKLEQNSVAHSVPFKDGHLAVQTWGDGETILLIHGWAANQTDMFSFVPEIVQSGYCAATFDLPAHGESSGEIVGLEEMSEAVLAVGKELGPLKGVIAHSVGGAATQLAIVSGLSVEKAVLLASPEDYEMAAHQFAQSKDFNDSEKQQMLEALAKLGVRVRIKSAEFVPDIVIPALIVHSKDDPVVPFVVGQNLSRYWKNSKFLEVDGLKHRGVLKDQNIIEAAVTFLTK